MTKKKGMIMASFSLVVAASLLVGGANVGSAASNIESAS